MTPTRRCIWVISDGRRGIENQALGLAEALSRIAPSVIIRKIIGSNPSFAQLPPLLQLLRRPRAVQYGLARPFPDIAIGCGRQAIAPLRIIKNRNPQSYIIYVQNPRSAYDHFDLIIAPEHDRLNRANALSMIGSPNRVTPPQLSMAKQDFQEPLGKYPAPYAALLIGGPSKRQTITPDVITAHITTAQDIMDRGYSLLITLSRRTDDLSRRAWRALAAKHDKTIWLHDDARIDMPNPYFAFLASADMIGVTEDSTNMLTEACALGRPIFRLPMAGEPGKFKELYSALSRRCHVEHYSPDIKNKAYPPLDETKRIAHLVEKKYNAFRHDINRSASVQEI